MLTGVIFACFGKTVLKAFQSAAAKLPPDVELSVRGE
jgi:hypothetical protein